MLYQSSTTLMQKILTLAKKAMCVKCYHQPLGAMHGSKQRPLPSAYEYAKTMYLTSCLETHRNAAPEVNKLMLGRF